MSDDKLYHEKERPSIREQSYMHDLKESFYNEGYRQGQTDLRQSMNNDEPINDLSKTIDELSMMSDGEYIETATRQNSGLETWLSGITSTGLTLKQMEQQLVDIHRYLRILTAWRGLDLRVMNSMRLRLEKLEEKR